MYVYSVEQNNPISPAYLDLQNSIIQSSTLGQTKTPLLAYKIIPLFKVYLFVAKVSYRLLRGYR